MQLGRGGQIGEGGGQVGASARPQPCTVRRAYHRDPESIELQLVPTASSARRLLRDRARRTSQGEVHWSRESVRKESRSGHPFRMRECAPYRRSRSGVLRITRPANALSIGPVISSSSTHTKAAPAFGMTHPSKRNAMLGVGPAAGSRDSPGCRLLGNVVEDVDVPDAAAAVGELDGQALRRPGDVEMQQMTLLLDEDAIGVGDRQRLRRRHGVGTEMDGEHLRSRSPRATSATRAAVHGALHELERGRGSVLALPPRKPRHFLTHLDSGHRPPPVVALAKVFGKRAYYDHWDTNTGSVNGG